MTEEEKFIKGKIEECTRLIEASSYIGNKKAYAKERTQFKCVLARIQKLQKENLDAKEEVEKKDKMIAYYKQIYENLRRDFENYKNDKDINYLDGTHHKQLVEKSIGQKIDKPEECWFDIFEVKIIKNDKLYGVAINKDFVTLKQISDESPEQCITVIAESPLSGAIYRYNNYGNKEWQLIGTMLGYA